MDAERFRASPIGTVVPLRGFDARHNEEYDHWAYIPDPLPRVVELSPATWAAASEAARMLGRLDEASSALPNPAILRYPSLRREAVSTSALEGTYAALEEVLEAEAEPDAPRSPEIREVLQYVNAAELAFRTLAERGLTFGFIAELQDFLVRGTSGERPDTGRIRETPVMIGEPAGRLHEARFIPPPAGDQLRSGVDAWVEWVREPPVLPVVVECALSHYQFETLHPFSDGNGRIGRLLIVLELLVRGALREPVLTVSPWLEARRDEYQDQLLNVSATGDFDPWVDFFARAVTERSETTIAQITALTDVGDAILERLRAARITGVARELADTLISGGIVTTTLVARTYNVTPQAAHYAVKRLEEVGVLQRVGTRRYRQMWYAPEVQDAIRA